MPTTTGCSASKAITRITRTDLIIVDDIGLLPASPDTAEGFYRLVDAVYERPSLAASSNLHPRWLDEDVHRSLPLRGHRRPLDLQRHHHRDGQRRLPARLNAGAGRGTAKAG
ncbi:ATP-binding protein [Kitasatospora sp. NPDC057542]|uniref:ATP-binding protein n=1 Tax=Kitasatospora sp. NPDC057542 TaxID=3346162 RepID=UPI003683FACA